MTRISFHLLICLTWTWFRDTEFSLMTEDKGILSDIENLAKVVCLCVFSSVRVWAPDPRFPFTFSTFFFFFFFLPAFVDIHFTWRLPSHSLFFASFFLFFRGFMLIHDVLLLRIARKYCLVREREKISYGQLPRFFS